MARSQIGTFNVGSLTADKFQGLFIALHHLGFDMHNTATFTMFDNWAHMG